MSMALRWVALSSQLVTANTMGLNRRLFAFPIILLHCLSLLHTDNAVRAQGQFGTSVARDQEQLTSTATATPKGSPTVEAIATHTPVIEIEATEHNILYRPIELANDKVHWIDRTYPYGSTQLGRRTVHLGVEFVNARNTPVYAAKAGTVVFAGADSKTLLGPQLGFYGNVVVLAHDIRTLAGRQIFTVYGHLESVAVEVGEVLDDLDLIGEIGSSGIAIGPHLHFEVRVEDPFDYRMTRNPELWLQHYANRGMIIGYIQDRAGNPIFGKRVTVRSESASRDVYTYGSDLVNSDPVWRENFSIGDLAAGDYEIIVLSDNGNISHRDNISVKAYRTNVVEIVLTQ